MNELGRFPFHIIRKVHIIKYWMRLLKEPDTSLIKLVYLMLKKETDHNCNYNGGNWASQIKQLLQEHGFDYVWQLQTEIKIPFARIKLRIFDNYKQSWYGNINNSPRLQAYSNFKHNFELEKYLDIVSDMKYKIALTRFRTSSHSFF